MASVTKTLPIPGSKSQPLKSTRAKITFDPANPNASRTLVITNVTKNRRGRTTATTDTTYTQGTDGMFRDSSGTIWSGEYDGSGSQVRNTMGRAINSANVTDATVDSWGTNATGLKKKDTQGSSTGGGTDKGTTVATNIEPKQPTPKNRTNYAQALRYPEAMMDDSDFMTITMYQYEPGNFGKAGKPSERITHSLGSVILPIPPGLTDGNTVGWGEHKMNALQMVGASAALDAMNSDDLAKNIGETAGKAIDAVKQMPGAKNLVQSYLLSQVGALGASQDQLMARRSGQILNPNLELLFNGPALRSFQYTFRMTARSAKEATTIQKIIRFFKQGMSAKSSSGGGMYLATPNVFHVQFKNGKGKEHEFIGKLKKAAMTGFNVNYVPDGTYMTLPNSAMTAYEIGMSFQEMEPILDEDYGTTAGIGY